MAAAAKTSRRAHVMINGKLVALDPVKLAGQSREPSRAEKPS
jgi:hypothetical protein